MNYDALIERIIDEDDFSEGSAFTIAAMKAAQKGEPTFKLGSKTFKTKVSKEKADKFFRDKKDEASCSMEEGDGCSEENEPGISEAKKKAKKYYGPKQYGAPAGSERAAKLKKAAELYKKGDVEGAARIRKDMEKQHSDSPSFKPRKSQYTDSKNEAELCESLLDDLLDEMLIEILEPEQDLLEEKKKRKKVTGSARTALKNKAEKHNAPLGALTTVYNKGMGAYVSSGSRKGMSAQQWAMARVNSFLKGGKARKVDDAQWKQVQKFRKKKRK